MKRDSKMFTRREFLVGLWAILAATAAGVAGGIGLWHASPPADEAAQALIELDAPPPPDNPVEIPAGKFAWVRQGPGVAAISEVCPHMGCVLAWQEQEGRFQCPCHGSTFDAAGQVMHGPADHALSYLEVTALDGDGRVVDRTAPGHLWVQTGPNLRYRVDPSKPIAAPNEDAAAT